MFHDNSLHKNVTFDGCVKFLPELKTSLKLILLQTGTFRIYKVYIFTFPQNLMQNIFLMELHIVKKVYYLKLRSFKQS